MDQPTRSPDAEPSGPVLPEVAGFVLAGGRSSRMGTDKALVPLGGKPLIWFALEKLRELTRTVSILGGPAPGNPALGRFAPLVFDLHPGCGPAAGIEAALASSGAAWNLILPVDVPFLPPELLHWWVGRTVADSGSPVRIAFFRVDGVVHPAVLLVHRDVGSGIGEAIERGEYKLLRVLEFAARKLAPSAVPGASPGPVLEIAELPITVPWASPVGCVEGAGGTREDGLPPRAMWFANVNTPEDLLQAERYLAGEWAPSDPFAAGR